MRIQVLNGIDISNLIDYNVFFINYTTLLQLKTKERIYV